MSTKAKVLAYLAGYGLQDKGGGKYRCNSPLRPDSDGLNFTLMINDNEHGAFRDWKTDEMGSLYDLCRLLGIDVDGRFVESTERNYSGIEDYAKAHALTGEQLIAAGWQETTHKGRKALSFQTVGGLRYRFLDDKKPKYISEYGLKQSFYGLNAKLADYLKQGMPLVLVNGEISVITGRYHKIPAITVTAGEKRYPQNLIDELLAFLGDLRPEIWIALDCDQTGRNASKELAEQFKNLGFAVKELDLGLGDKGDLSDFCLLNGADSLMRLYTCDQIERSPQATKNRRLYHADELHKLPKIAYIIEGEIPTQGLVMVFGPSGVGKSFVTLDYALKIAQSNTVIYVAGEGQGGFLQRVEAWKKHHESQAGNLYFYLHSLSMLALDDFKDFVDLVKPVLPDVIVIDTLARAMTGSDENSTRDMGLFVRACNELTEKLACTVILVHHTSKAGQAERGNSSLRGALDVAIRISQRDDLIVIESSKTKDSAPFPTRFMQLKPVEVEIHGEIVNSVVVVDSANVRQRDTDDLTTGQVKILDFLNLSIYSASGAVWGDIKQNSDIPLGSLGRILSTLKDLGYVEKRGESYSITDLGKSKLGGGNIGIGDSDSDTES